MDREVKNLLRLVPEFEASVHVMSEGSDVELVVVRVTLLYVW